MVMAFVCLIQLPMSLIIFLYENKTISVESIIYNHVDNFIYLASRSDGVYKINADDRIIRKTTLSIPLKHNVTSKFIDSEGILWLTIERNGYYKYKIKTDTFDYLDYNEWPMFVNEDKERNQFYTGTWLGDFIIFDGNNLNNANARYVLPTKFEGYEKVIYYDCSKATQITGENILWVLTKEGIGLFDLTSKNFIKHIFYQPQNIDGLSNNWTTNIFIAKDGQIWISSWYGLINVNKVAQSFAKHYLPELDVNLYNLVSGIADDPYDKNKAWMSVDGTGLAEYDKKSSTIKKWHFKEFSKPFDNNYQRRWCHNIKKDTNGVLWVGSYGGYAKVHKGEVKFINTYVNGNSIYANDVYQDHQSMLWALGEYLQKFNPYTLQYDSWQLPKKLREENPFNEFVVALDGDKDELFVGTKRGLFTFNKTTHEFHKIEINIDKINDKAYNNVRTLAKINDKLYLGTYGGVLEYNLKSNTFKKLLTDYIELKGMTKDKLENLWIYSSQGLYRLNAQTNKLDKFDQNDGVYNLSSDPAVFFEYKNEMYLGHRSVVTKFNPENIYINNSPPHPYVTEVFCSKYHVTKSSESLQDLVLKYNEADISINFSAIEYNYPAKLQFSYKLEGYDKEWSSYGFERTKSYTNLPHGHYIFKVKAKNSVGTESNTIATFAFEVTPALWQTLWFQLLTVLSFLSAVILISRFRIRNIRKREEEKTASNKRIAELDAKLLRSQMNPHFIFNSLNSIQKYIWENNEEDAAEYLSKFAKLMRSILENSSREFITLQSEFETLKIYLELEHKRSNGHFDYSIHIDETIDQSREVTPPMLLQPFLENAIWHGLNKKETHGNLLISVEKKENEMIFVVDDDGVGRGSASMQVSDNEKKSLGIAITKQRIEKLFDATDMAGKIEIIDKQNNGRSLGTRVIISLPLINYNNA